MECSDKMWSRQSILQAELLDTDKMLFIIYYLLSLYLHNLASVISFLYLLFSSSGVFKNLRLPQRGNQKNLSFLINHNPHIIHGVILRSPAEHLDVLQGVRHLQLGSLGEDEAGDGAEDTED